MTTRRNLLRAAAATTGLGVAAAAGTGSAEAVSGGSALGWYDVTAPAYGATGNGSTDDTQAIRAALAAASPGDTVYLPNGRYQISGPLTVPNGVKLQGSGSSWYSGGLTQQTTINATASFSGEQLVLIDGSALSRTAVSIRDLTLRASDLPAGSTAGLAAIGDVSQLLVENVAISTTPGPGVRLAAQAGRKPMAVRFRNVSTFSCGARTPSHGFDLNVADSQFTSCLAMRSSLSGWGFGACSNNQLIGCRAEHNARHGFEWTNDTPIGATLFDACTTDQNDQDGFHFDALGGTATVQLIGCCARRDGNNRGQGSDSYSGYSVTQCTAPVLLSGSVTTARCGDSGTGTAPRFGVGPHFGITVTASGFVTVEAATLSTDPTGSAVNWDSQGVLALGPNLITGTCTGTTTTWSPAPGLHSGPDRLAFTSADTTHSLLDPTPQPADQGLLTWSFDPSALASSGTPAAGTIQLVRVLLRTPQTVSEVLAAVVNPGASLTAGQNLAGLYNAAGTRLAATADQSTAWTSSGLKAMALTFAPGVPARLPAGSYWVALVANGTTPPAFGRGSFLSVSTINAGTTGASLRYGQYGNGQTALPDQLPMASMTGSPSSYWVALR